MSSAKLVSPHPPASLPKKKSAAHAALQSAETGVLFRSFRSVTPGRVPKVTITLCHEGGFSPTPKTVLLRQRAPRRTGTRPVFFLQTEGLADAERTEGAM